MGNFLEKYGFKPDNYYKVGDGIVYRNVAAGLIKEEKPFNMAFRKVGNYKIYAVHHRVTQPYTVYYIVVDNVVYRAEYYESVINDMVEDLELLAKGFKTI